MAADGITQTPDDLGSQVKDKVADLGQVAADKIDSKRKLAADGLAAAAQKIHTGADALPGVGQRAAGVAHGAADKLNLTADYLRAKDLKAMAEDVKTLARNNPVPAMLTAAALGFLIAKAFSRRD